MAYLFILLPVGGDTDLGEKGLNRKSNYLHVYAKGITLGFGNFRVSCKYDTTFLNYINNSVLDNICFGTRKYGHNDFKATVRQYYDRKW